jgi:hypothetical protein
MRDSGVEGNVTYRGRVRMRRVVLMLGLAALAATVLALPALADGSGATTCPRHEAPEFRTENRPSNWISIAASASCCCSPNR